MIKDLFISAESIEKLEGVALVDAIASHIAPILEGLGMDLDDPSTRDTPKRFAKYLLEFHQEPDIDELLGKAFESDDTAMVVQRNIPFRMICEHHLLPAVGRAVVGYVPKGRVCGLSKLTRLVQGIGVSQPSLQEHICHRIADALEEKLDPLGVMVVIEGEHGCMSCRGVNSPGVVTITSAIRGVFKTEAAARMEFLALGKGSTL